MDEKGSRMLVSRWRSVKRLARLVVLVAERMSASRLFIRERANVREAFSEFGMRLLPHAAAVKSHRAGLLLVHRSFL